MQIFTVAVPEELGPKNKVIIEKLRNELGFVPNLYLYLGHSESVLSNYLAFQQGHSNGVFSSREREAIYLAIAEVNECRYGLSIHSYLAKLNGFSEDEVINIRLGNASDSKIYAITKLATEILETHGKPSEKALHNFFCHGYGQGALVELVALVSGEVFANYTSKITKISIDFPLAPELEETVTLH